jgi:hypothetical protein
MRGHRRGPTLTDTPESAAESDAPQLESMVIHGDRVAYRDEDAAWPDP